MNYLISMIPGVGVSCSVILFLFSANQLYTFKKTLYKRSLSIGLFCLFSGFFAFEHFVAQSRVFSPEFTHIYVIFSSTCLCLSQVFYINSISFFVAVPDWLYKTIMIVGGLLSLFAFTALPAYLFFGYSFYFETDELLKTTNYFMNSYSTRVGLPQLLGTSILSTTAVINSFAALLILRIVYKSSQDAFFLFGLFLTIFASVMENFLLPFTFSYFVPLIFFSNIFEAYRMNSLVNEELRNEIKNEIDDDQEVTEVDEQDKYQNSNLTSERLNLLADKVRLALEEDKIYLKPNLNSELLAHKVGIPAYQLSQVVNIGLQTTFFDLLSHYRINEVKERLGDPQHSGETIINIAYDSGFNSKSSFNTAFKKQTGMTPSAYRKSLKKSP